MPRLLAAFLISICLAPAGTAEPKAKAQPDIFTSPRRSGEFQGILAIAETRVGMLLIADKHQPPLLPQKVTIELSAEFVDPIFKKLEAEVAAAKNELAMIEANFQTSAEKAEITKRIDYIREYVYSETNASKYQELRASRARLVVHDTRMRELRAGAELKIQTAQANLSDFIAKHGPKFEEMKNALRIELSEKGRAASEELAKKIVAASRPNLALRSLRWVGRVGGGLILIDVAGRAYVWYELEADPSFSPVTTYLLHHTKDISLSQLFAAANQERAAAVAWNTQEKSEDDYFSRVRKTK